MDVVVRFDFSWAYVEVYNPVHRFWVITVSFEFSAEFSNLPFGYNTVYCPFNVPRCYRHRLDYVVTEDRGYVSSLFNVDQMLGGRFNPKA